MSARAYSRRVLDTRRRKMRRRFDEMMRHALRHAPAARCYMPPAEAAVPRRYARNDARATMRVC